MEEKPIFIDSETYKVMKYVYRHNEVKLGDIYDKFGRDGISNMCYLCQVQYALYRKPDGVLTLDTSSLDNNGSFGLVHPGNCYVENRKLSFTKWVVPTLISVLALITSVAALISSLSNEVFVHLIK